MNDAKYIGMDVHQATISVGGSGFERESGDGGHSRNESGDDSSVYSRPARQFVRDPGRRNLGRLVARSAPASCQHECWSAIRARMPC